MDELQKTSIPLQIGEFVEVTLMDLGREGQGIGRTAEGQTCFVPSALPGEIVRARVTALHPNFLEAEVQDFLQLSPDRQLPPCPHADLCGGCTLQHLRYEAQLKWKQSYVQNCLQRIARISAPYRMLPIKGMQACPSLWGSRHKCQLPVSSKTYTAGYYQKASHRLVPFQSCLQHPPILDQLKSCIENFLLRSSKNCPHEQSLRHIILRCSERTREVLVLLVLQGSKPKESKMERLKEFWAPLLPLLLQECMGFRLRGLVLNFQNQKRGGNLGLDFLTLWGDSFYEEKLLQLRYRIPAPAFFQINPFQAEHFFQSILDFAAPQADDCVLDLYCGVGSLSLPLAQRANQVLALETVAPAVKAARVNARLNQLENKLTFSVGKAEVLLPRWAASGLNPNIVVVDPPRKGCAFAVLQALQVLNPEKIVYGSCDPATLARDLAVLQRFGYQLQQVQCVDMFPWTSHVETVCLMTRV